MDTTVSLPADGAAHGVGDPHQQPPLALAVPQRQQRVRCLPGLGDEEAGVVTEDGSASVQEIGGQVDHHGHLGQLLQQLSCGYG